VIIAQQFTAGISAGYGSQSAKRTAEDNSRGSVVRFTDLTY
jgi:hypothetical protein